jgi:hypothetical protein
MIRVKKISVFEDEDHNSPPSIDRAKESDQLDQKNKLKMIFLSWFTAAPWAQSVEMGMCWGVVIGIKILDQY